VAASLRAVLGVEPGTDLAAVERLFTGLDRVQRIEGS
jgi:hypothetical protein